MVLLLLLVTTYGKDSSKRNGSREKCPAPRCYCIGSYARFGRATRAHESFRSDGIVSKTQPACSAAPAAAPQRTRCGIVPTVSGRMYLARARV
jgi:hypothetical protein